jgi:uncharacterized protein DUF998
MFVAVRSSRRKLGVAAVLWMTAALVFLLFEGLAAGAVVPSYSYVYGFISDLGVPAWSPWAVLMNAAFWVQGILFVTGAVLIARALGRGWLLVILAALNAAGNIMVAVAHGGSALVANGYTWVHVLGAIFAILGGNAAIVVGSSVVGKAVGRRGYRLVSAGLAVLGFACFALLSVFTSTTDSDLPDGALERGCVYSILAWQAFTGVVLLARPARAG